MTKLPQITEEQFLQQVVDLAHLKGWKVAHFRPALTSKGYRTPCQFDAKGFPDLVMVRDNRVIFAEIKTDTGKVSPEQQDWFDKLTEASDEVYIWRPKYWDDPCDGIMEVLK